ncbi:hypothetical protein [Caballeronia sordidicola]|uniref:Uncharacterized protein n=1 Tax=Caballeronia sordidicola TaxID=196367 RepID=A0A242MEC9_CABSO|nr:hypothetical protein [Caballeronia sordidicola]OTP69499.1 hypothetical protein PAMC26577_31140 [Caballeronia sordidicola]
MNLKELLLEARHAQGSRVHDNGNAKPFTIVGRDIVRSVIDLNGSQLDKIQAGDGSHYRLPVGTPAVENYKIDAAIIKQSLVAKAGAEVVIFKDPTTAVPTGTLGDVILTSVPAYFQTIEAAPFALVVDGANVGVTPLPISRAQINVDTSSGPQTNTGIYGLRFEFSRATLKSYPSVEAAIMHAIIAGLARTADAVLLNAIVAAAPAAFSLAAAAALNVRMSELRGIVGTAANGATIDQNGVLRAAGIESELTAEIVGTIVGTFARSAIMIRSDVDVLAERTKIDGSLSVTAWAAIQPLLPDTSRFWTVAA